MRHCLFNGLHGFASVLLLNYLMCRFDEAAEALKREMDYYETIENNGVINKLVMGLVLVHLHRQDYVAADLAFKAALKLVAFYLLFQSICLSTLWSLYQLLYYHISSPSVKYTAIFITNLLVIKKKLSPLLFIILCHL